MALHLENPSLGVHRNPDKLQWALHYPRIHSENSQVNEGLMQVLEENVTCTGSFSVQETRFKLYSGGVDGLDVMFECIGGSSEGMMLCVDSNHRLTARKRTKIYNNFRDAEEDVLFFYEIPAQGSQYQFRWKKDGSYVAFNKDGQPIPLNDPDISTEETLFRAFLQP